MLLLNLFAEFNKYRRDRVRVNESAPPITGLLWIHLLAGRGLKAATVPANQGSLCVHTLFEIFILKYEIYSAIFFFR